MGIMTFPTEIVVQSGNRTLRWPYKPDDTVLETARRSGFQIPTQCERAYCGSCIIQLVKGEIDLRINDVLSEADIADGLRVACQGVPSSEICEIELM